jgi:tyramine---L-glutamate ligase
MKKILIYEYITGGGLLNEDLTSGLRDEANMITSSIYDSCRKSRYFKYNYFKDYRLLAAKEKEAIVLRNNSKIYDLNFLNQYDYVLPVLPEIDMSLYLYVKYLETNGINAVISNSQTIKICSDKLDFYKFCQKKNLLTIETYKKYKSNLRNKLLLIKDRYGAGCSYIETTKDIKNLKLIKEDKVIQPYIDGEDYSVSVYFTKNNFYILTVNKQILKYRNNKARLSSIIVNVKPPSYLKITSLVSRIKDALPGLYGFAGIDIIIKGNDIFITEINPRLTTSFIGIYDTIGVNIIDLIISRKSLKNIISGKKYYINNHE